MTEKNVGFRLGVFDATVILVKPPGRIATIFHWIHFTLRTGMTLTLTLCVGCPGINKCGAITGVNADARCGYNLILV